MRAGGEALADCFGEVANVRVRTVATVGGVLADADYACDPPAMLLRARRRGRARGAAAASARLAIEELILGHYARRSSRTSCS